MKLPRLLVLCTLLLLVCRFDLAAQQVDRQVAVTGDDLPGGSANVQASDAIAALTRRLLGTFREQKVPVVGFVNEKKPLQFGEVDNRIEFCACGLTMVSSSETTPTVTYH